MNNHALRIICVLFLTVILFPPADAQRIRRETISSFGSSNTIDGLPIRQTVGQPFSTVTFMDGNLGIHPGFQQTVFYGRKIETADLQQKISIYPNPAAAYIRIESSESIQHGTIKVMDMNGKSILNKKVPGSRDFMLGCNDWPDGLYVIRILDTDKNVTYTSRVIISK